MGIHVPTLLEGILEATAAKAQAEARITTIRAALEDEARRRLKAEGAAPSWNTPNLGKVRLDPAGDWTATVTDSDEFASYIAERHPTEATVAIQIKAEDAADALQALEFIDVQPVSTRVEVRTAFLKGFLEGLDVDVTETTDANAQLVRTFIAYDPETEPGTNAVVPGVGGTRSEAKIVVTLDSGRRTAAIKEARSTATALVEAATAEDDDNPVDLEALDVRRRELEDLHGDQLAGIAKGHGLGASGTKAALAERIARAEQATGLIVAAIAEANDAEAAALAIFHSAEVQDVIDNTVAQVLDMAGVSPLPEGTEVEEVSTVPLDQPVEEVPDGGDVADAWDDDRPGMMRVHIAQQRAAALDKAHNREVLRFYAKARGLSAAGAKADVIERLVAVGVTVDNLTHVNTAQETTP